MKWICTVCLEKKEPTQRIDLRMNELTVHLVFDCCKDCFDGILAPFILLVVKNLTDGCRKDMSMFCACCGEKLLSLDNPSSTVTGYNKVDILIGYEHLSLTFSLCLDCYKAKLERLVHAVFSNVYKAKEMDYQPDEQAECKEGCKEVKNVKKNIKK